MQLPFFTVILGLCCALSSVTFAADHAPEVAPEVFQAAQTAATVKPSLRFDPNKTPAARRSASAQALSMQYALPALTDSEQQALRTTGNTTDKTLKTGLKVGLGRALPSALSSKVDLTQWTWQSVDGGQVAHFTLSSSGAERVRLQVQIGALPTGVELRFYAPNDTSTVFQADLTAQSSFWSPTVSGDSLSVEVFLPATVQASEVELSFVQLSHFVLDPAAAVLKSSATSTADYSTCQVDLACASSEWQATGKAVARYVFTDTDGYSYLCSGTLLADSDSSTQIPYFFTAAHCVSNATAASTMEMFWLYANSTCGGNDASAVQTTGGAQLLVTKPALDTTLVRLNTDPPTGVTMAGWTTTPLSAGQTVTGIHHGLGYPKKYASGAFNTRVSVSSEAGGYVVTPDSNGSFSQVVWNTGITAPGSSGSGVFVVKNGVHYLNGSLLGGSSECTATSAPDEYSRFELVYPDISAWLWTTTPSFRLFGEGVAPNALVDGVVISRYLQGMRGVALTSGVTTQAVDNTVLEMQLAKIQAIMDVDQDGKTDASKDAQLLMRYLLGLRQSALVSGLDFTGSGRKDAVSITTYLDSVVYSTK